MSLVSEIYFRSVTGDYATPASAVEENLDQAQEMVQDYLRRRLPYGTYTEALPVNPQGLVYPSAIPVAEVPASATYTVFDETTLRGVSTDPPSWTDWPDFQLTTDYPLGGYRGSGYEANMPLVSVTYTGGFTAETLPVTIRQGIVRLARALPLQFTSSARPAGASSVGVGDVRMSWREGDTAEVIDQFVPGLSKMLKGYRLDVL